MKLTSALVTAGAVVSSAFVPSSHHGRTYGRLGQLPFARTPAINPMVSPSERCLMSNDPNSSPGDALPTPDSRFDEQGLLKPFDIAPDALEVRQNTKNGMNFMMTLLRAFGVLQGKKNPYMDFIVKNEPPSLFVNYRIHPDKVDDLRQYLGLPEHIKLMPVACTTSDKPEYLITLNCYLVYIPDLDQWPTQNIANALRAEWSIYFDRGDGRPSYMIFDSQTDKFTMDPVSIVVPPDKFTYTDTDGHLEIELSNRYTPFFSFDCDMKKAKIEEKLPDPTWIAANDYVYWSNGVRDTVFYNGEVVDRPIYEVDSKFCKIDNHLPWMQYLDSDYCQVLMLSEGAQFVISQWSNLKENGGERLLGHSFIEPEKAENKTSTQ